VSEGHPVAGIGVGGGAIVGEGLITTTVGGVGVVGPGDAPQAATDAVTIATIAEVVHRCTNCGGFRASDWRVRLIALTTGSIGY
jgi:hypothetical protein